MNKLLTLSSLILLASCANVPPSSEQLTDTGSSATRSEMRPIGIQVVGTWIDRIPGLSGRITIYREANGAVTYELVHQNGKKTRLRLQEIEKGRKFRVIDCSHGDNFRVKPNGDLEMWDREGFIRTVKRAQ